jgi:hypothetical protein
MSKKFIFSDIYYMVMMVFEMDIKAPKKSPKFPQHIWLDADVYRWIVDLATDKGVAPNIVISQLVRAVYEGQQSGKVQPVVTIEKQLKIYRCPFCEFETQKLADIIDHISDKHKDKLRELAV